VTITASTGSSLSRHTGRLVVAMASTILVSGPLLAQVTAPTSRPPVSPARPPDTGSQPAAKPPTGATGTPEIIRPTATLGPAPATAGANALPATGQAVAGPIGNTPRVAGVARYRSVAKPDMVMFDAPSDKAKKIFLAPQGMPVEVISVLRTWVKVRDPLGDLAWVSRDDLTDRRMLMATTIAVLRRDAQPSAAPWFSVDRGVVLELLEERPINGFLKVRYTEGQIGYIQPDQVWGI